MTEEPTKPSLDPHAKVCRNCVWWSANHGAEILKSEDKVCFEPHQTAPWTDDEFSCEYFLGSDATEVNVPQMTPAGTMNFRNAEPITDPIEILIVTYSKDFNWLQYALTCISKHAKRFQGVTVAHPAHEAEMFTKLHSNRYDFRLRLHAYDEVAGNGFLQHEAKMAHADSIVPEGTKFVMHMDGDCMMKMSNEPEDYFLNNKPIYIWRTWDSLSSPDPHDPRKKVVSDCIMWKEMTAKQMGFHSPAYTMARHPTLFPIGFYKPYRDHISAHHRIPFDEYMLSGQQNAHPQDRADFTAMGQYAYHFMHDQFHWINCATEEYPADRMKAYWSHGGIGADVQKEIEGFLA